MYDLEKKAVENVTSTMVQILEGIGMNATGAFRLAEDPGEVRQHIGCKVVAVEDTPSLSSPSLYSALPDYPHWKWDAIGPLQPPFPSQICSCTCLICRIESHTL